MSKERRYSGIVNFLRILAILLLVVGCGGLEDVRPRTMFGEGVEVAGPDHLQIYLNVGVLAGKSEMLYPRERVERWLALASANFRRKHPELEVIFLLDQPQDTEFITARAIGRNRLPMVSPFPLRLDDDAKRQYLRGISLLSLAKTGVSGLCANLCLPLDSLKMSRLSVPSLEILQGRWKETVDVDQQDPEVSAYRFLTFWQSYSYSQIHYDIILTDTPVVPDDPYGLRTWNGEPRNHYLLPAPGRAALDRISVLVSISPPGEDGAEQRAIISIEEALDSLLFPGNSQREPELRAIRLKIMTAVSEFHNAGKKPGCSLWNDSSYHYSDTWQGLDPTIASLLRENKRNMDRLCRDFR